MNMIRKFKLSDLEAILEIEAKSFKYPYDKLTFLFYHETYLDSFLVYESKGKVLGYFIFSPDGHIHSIAVEPPHRRKKIGTEFVQEIMRVSRGRIWVEVRKSNKIAQEFYKALGFKKKCIIPDYYGNEDAYVMVLTRKNER